MLSSSFSLLRDEGRDSRKVHQDAIVLQQEQREGLTLTKKDKAKNLGQILKGKFKVATGKAVGNNNLQAHGKEDQMLGNLSQAGEKIKDAFKE